MIESWNTTINYKQKTKRCNEYNLQQVMTSSQWLMSTEKVKTDKLTIVINNN